MYRRLRGGQSEQVLRWSTTAHRPSARPNSFKPIVGMSTANTDAFSVWRFGGLRVVSPHHGSPWIYYAFEVIR